jgi:hypothetical protein
MTRITTTSQKKNTTIPGMTYPATLLDLATASSYPAPPGLSATGMVRRGVAAWYPSHVVLRTRRSLLAAFVCGKVPSTWVEIPPIRGISTPVDPPGRPGLFPRGWRDC